jgi:hypothetical protein
MHRLGKRQERFVVFLAAIVKNEESKNPKDMVGERKKSTEQRQSDGHN